MLDYENIYLEHFGAKGMKWGVRKTPAQKASADKAKQQLKADKRQFKISSKLTGGELVVSALVAGPIGVLTYKAIKHRAATTKFKNRDLSAEEQTNVAKKLGIGEALAITVLTSPVGLVTYAVAKNVAANETEAI